MLDNVIFDKNIDKTKIIKHETQIIKIILLFVSHTIQQ